MQCQNILKPSVAVAVGCFALFLAPYCLAAAIDSATGLPQKLLVPFNDLLPPLSEAEFEKTQTVSKTTKPTITTTTATTSTTTIKPITYTTTTTEAPTTPTTTHRTLATFAPPKPTKAATTQQLKKSHYQLEQQQRNVQKPLLTVPILNLNPEVAPLLLEAQTPLVPVKVTKSQQAQHLQHIQAAQTQYKALQQHLQPQKLQQQKQQFTKQLLQQQQQQQPQQVQHKLQPEAAASTIASVASPQPKQTQTEQRVNIDQLQQYLEYVYHPTTRRPSRGALPTLTPFPRHLK